MKRGIQVVDLKDGGTAHAPSNLRREREFNAPRRQQEDVSHSAKPIDQPRPAAKW